MTQQDNGTIGVYQAISEMRRITASGGTFAVKFRKWNRQKLCGGDLAVVNQARLRPKPHESQVSDSGWKVFLTDTETGRNLVCWECLLVEFNGQKTVLL